MSKKESLITAKALLTNEHHPGHVLVLKKQDGERDDIPGGKIDGSGGKEGGEDIAAGLEREIREELGAEVKIRDARWVAKQSERLGKHAVRAWHTFVGHVEEPAGGFELSHEHRPDYRWVPVEEFGALNIPQRYKDALAIGETVLRELGEPALAEDHAIPATDDELVTA